jgi:hypothetical protein
LKFKEAATVKFFYVGESTILPLAMLETDMNVGMFANLEICRRTDARGEIIIKIGMG